MRPPLLPAAGVALGALLGLFLLAPAPSSATTLQTAVPVGATVITRCVVEIQTIDLGRYTPTGREGASSAGQFRFTCTRGGVVSVALSATGMASPCSDDHLAVASPGGENLRYVLYQDATRHTVWGCAGDHVASFMMTESSMQLPWYGEVPEGQDVRAGAFSGSTVLTVSF
jgi:spore coat protein U-like protein